MLSAFRQRPKATNKVKLKKRKIKRLNFQLEHFREEWLVSCTRILQSPVGAEAPHFSQTGQQMIKEKKQPYWFINSKNMKRMRNIKAADDTRRIKPAHTCFYHMLIVCFYILSHGGLIQCHQQDLFCVFSQLFSAIIASLFNSHRPFFKADILSYTWH